MNSIFTISLKNFKCPSMLQAYYIAKDVRWETSKQTTKLKLFLMDQISIWAQNYSWDSFLRMSALFHKFGVQKRGWNNRNSLGHNFKLNEDESPLIYGRWYNSSTTCKTKKETNGEGTKAVNGCESTAGENK